jgi:hypothetical protein
VLAELIAAGYIAATEEELLVIARDLDDTTLFDLQADLGLDLGLDIGPDFASASLHDMRPAAPWLHHLIEVLGSLDRFKRDIMSVPVKSFIALGPPVERARAAE